jgi:hypothetical protein
MKTEIRKKIEEARRRSDARLEGQWPAVVTRGRSVRKPKPETAATLYAPPMLVNDPFVQQCLSEINQGKLLTLPEAAERLKMKHEAVRRLFAREPGVVKINSMYRIPESVFIRVMLRSTIQPRPSSVRACA